jgi:hypothetical protein
MNAGGLIQELLKVGPWYAILAILIWRSPAIIREVLSHRRQSRKQRAELDLKRKKLMLEVEKQAQKRPPQRRAK